MVTHTSSFSLMEAGALISAACGTVEPGGRGSCGFGSDRVRICTLHTVFEATQMASVDPQRDLVLRYS